MLLNSHYFWLSHSLCILTILHYIIYWIPYRRIAKNPKYKHAEDIHLPVTEIHLKSHEWFGDFITKHEIPRKLFHSSIGFITLYYYTKGVDYRLVNPFLIVGFVTVFVLDCIRLNWPFFNFLYCRVVGALMRKKEIHTYNGVLWYLLGLIYSFTFFSKDVILISLFLLSWSDTAASTIGRRYGSWPAYHFTDSLYHTTTGPTSQARSCGPQKQADWDYTKYRS